MCGECSELAGLHVPEDLLHLDIYDPEMKAFVYDGNCGRGVLTHALRLVQGQAPFFSIMIPRTLFPSYLSRRVPVEGTYEDCQSPERSRDGPAYLEIQSIAWMLKQVCSSMTTCSSSMVNTRRLYRI